MLKTSSLLLSNSTNNLQDLHAKKIVIYDKTGKTRHIYNNVTLAGLMKLIGKNEITINSTGILSLPRMGPQHDYVGISVPPKFNMTVNVFPDKLSSAEINTFMVLLLGQWT